MKKILAFAGSTSSTSINKKLATYAAQNLTKNEYDIIDLRDFDLPIYSIDLEKNDGFPKAAKKFTNLLDSYDGFILSMAEHNGSYAAAFKNIFDWTSRIERKVFRDKPLLLMAASTGARGGQSVLQDGMTKFPHMGAKEIVSFSFPKFGENFNETKIINEELDKQLKDAVKEFEDLI